jgi:hypothetical protein
MRPGTPVALAPRSAKGGETPMRRGTIVRLLALLAALGGALISGDFIWP